MGKNREHSRTADCWCTPKTKVRAKASSESDVWEIHTFTNAVSNVYVCDCGEYTGNLQGYEAHIRTKLAEVS